MFNTIYNYLFSNYISKEEQEIQWILQNPQHIHFILNSKLYFLTTVFPQFQHILELNKTIIEQSKERFVCKSFVLKEKCKFGLKCMFLHTKDINVIKLTPCKFLDNCRRTNCPYGHEEFPDNSINDNCCNICLSDIYKMNKRFGLLLECDHKFCVQCLRQHRQNIQSYPDQKQRLSCPTCRVFSNNYFSSKVFLSGTKKKKEYQEYIYRCSKIPCKFSNTYVCPRSWNCHFKHIDS